MIQFERWTPNIQLIREAIDEFKQDHFLYTDGSPFQSVVQEYENNMKVLGWKLGKISICCWDDISLLGPSQYKVWKNRNLWEKSFWAFIIRQFLELSENVEPVEIYWFPINIPKQLENAPHPFHPIVWNTGSCHTMVGKPCRVYVVRWQEAWKVLVHELFHWIRIARSLEMPYYTNLWKKEKNWSSSGPLLMEEAWVEALASIWYPKWLITYQKKDSSLFETDYLPKAREQFSRLNNLCRSWWANTSPDVSQCLLSRNPFDSKACRSWYQDTNVYSYIFWKERIMSDDDLFQFMLYDLRKQQDLLKDKHLRLRISYLILRNLMEPMYSGKQIESIQIRFLPKLSDWMEKQDEDFIKLG